LLPLSIFIWRHLPFQFEARSLILVALIFLLFIVSARLTIPNRTVLPYAFPLAAMGLLIATLFGLETGIVFSIALAILVTYNLPNMLDLTPYYLFSSLTGVLVLGNARRVWTFFRAGMATAAAGIAMLLAFRFPFVQMDPIALLQLTGAAVFSGLAASTSRYCCNNYHQTLGLMRAAVDRNFAPTFRSCRCAMPEPISALQLPTWRARLEAIVRMHCRRASAHLPM
jgi:hypothetical protein